MGFTPILATRWRTPPAARRRGSARRRSRGGGRRRRTGAGARRMPGGCSFFAVYDGHGGDRAARCATDVMCERFVNSAAFKKLDIVKALKQAFHQTETEFLNIAGREGLRDGTTAIVAVVQEDTLTVAHVGDSRGVLCRGGKAVVLTEDHKPDLEPEKRRIEALGGFVSFIGCWRAMGILAMSRAIGDLFLKPYVSAEPDVRAMPIVAADEFIVLASDGVYDVLNNEQVVQIARSAASPEEAAQLLTESARVAGSLDNATGARAPTRLPRPRCPQALTRAPSCLRSRRRCAASAQADQDGGVAPRAVEPHVRARGGARRARRSYPTRRRSCDARQRRRRTSLVSAAPPRGETPRGRQPRAPARRPFCYSNAALSAELEWRAQRAARRVAHGAAAPAGTSTRTLESRTSAGTVPQSQPEVTTLAAPTAGTQSARSPRAVGGRSRASDVAASATDLRRFDTELILDERESARARAPTRNTSAHDFQALAEGGVDASKVTSRLESLLDNNLLRVLSIRRSISRSRRRRRPRPSARPRRRCSSGPRPSSRPRRRPRRGSSGALPRRRRRRRRRRAASRRGRLPGVRGGPAVALAPLSPFLRCSSPTALPLDLGAAAPSRPPPSERGRRPAQLLRDVEFPFSCVRVPVTRGESLDAAIKEVNQPALITSRRFGASRGGGGRPSSRPAGTARGSPPCGPPSP